MDRVSKLTEQLRIRQPHLSQDDFLALEDYNGVNGHLGPPIMNEEEEDLEPEPLGDLKVERRNEPPKDGFSNELPKDSLSSENVELLGNEIERRLKPVTTLQEVSFAFELKNYLIQKGFKTATTCQSFMWSAILRGSSVCCVGPPRIGKTSGYLLPLISSSINFRQNQKEGEIFTPYSLVLCPSGKSVRKVATEATKLIPSKPSRKPYIKIVFYDRPSAMKDKSRQADLLDGFDILITTPALFLHLTDLEFVTMNNCKVLVFDEADELLLLHPEESQKVHTLYVKSYRRERTKGALGDIADRVEDSLGAQVIVCSESYSLQIRHVVDNFIKRPVTVMSDKVEAAILARIECHVDFCNDGKEEALLNILGKYSWLDKTVICCKDRKESLIVKEAIGEGIHCEILSEDSKHFHFHRYKSIWRSKGRMILIVDDDILLSAIATIQIDDGRCLIHYSIPESKGTFASRFIFMQSWFKSPEKGRCVTAMILDSSNRKQAHELVLLIKQLGSPVPDGLIALRNTFPRGLCQSYAAFGHCPLKNLKCHYDHFCSTSNKMAENPRVGHQVKFIVTSVKSASSFFARIISYRGSEHVDGSWTATDYSQEYILERLQDIDLGGTLSPQELALGQLCATHHVTNGQRQVHRVRIEEFRDSFEDSYVKVFHLDHGFETVVKCRHLIPLPSQWSTYPPFAVKCYVLKFKPSYNETHWDQEASQIVLEALTKPQVSFLTGWVSNVYNSSFWIRDVHVYHRLPSLKTDLKAYSLMDLISNTDFFTDAKRPAFTSDISPLILETKTRWKVERQKNISAKAFFQSSGDQFHLIQCNKSTGDLFIRLVKFEQLLSNLEKEIAECDHNPVIFFSHGLICACQYYGGFNRVMVRQLTNETSVDVFFVDHGEVLEVDRKSCFEIKDKFISQLPFQAIKVRISDDISTWNEDQIYDLTRYPGDVFKKLHVEKLTSDPVPQVRIFVPVKETETAITFDDLVHLIQNGESELSDRSFGVEKAIAEQDSSDIEEEMSPEEKESARIFQEILEEKQRQFLESKGAFFPSGGQKPTRSNELPEPVLDGVDEDEGKEKQVIPVDGDVAAFDYELPTGIRPLPFDDVDDEEVESDDDIELKGNDDIDTIFEKFD